MPQAFPVCQIVGSGSAENGQYVRVEVVIGNPPMTQNVHLVFEYSRFEIFMINFLAAGASARKDRLAHDPEAEKTGRTTGEFLAPVKHASGGMGLKDGAMPLTLQIGAPSGEPMNFHFQLAPQAQAELLETIEHTRQGSGASGPIAPAKPRLN